MLGRSIRVFGLSLLAILVAQGAWAQDKPVGERQVGAYFPDSDKKWEHVAPEVANVDPAKLNDALKFAGQNNSQAVVVLWRGKILAEQYWQGWNANSSGPLYSATKSLVSTLVGMAIEDGKIKSLEQSCADFLPEWKGSPRSEQIQIQHLLSMTGGLRGSKKIFLQGLMAKDERAFATRLPIDHRPGQHWEYQNSAYHLLCPILEIATDQTLDQYTREKLFRPLNMQHAKWSRKRRNPDEYSFMSMSVRDAARFGLLMLRKGDWQGKQLVSREWVAEATAPWNEQVNPSYGGLWWLNGGEFHRLPLQARRQRGPIFPGCPDDAFAALGKDDQKLYVVPSLNLVVTRLGGVANYASPALSEFDGEFLGRICGSFSQHKSESSVSR